MSNKRILKLHRPITRSNQEAIENIEKSLFEGSDPLIIAMGGLEAETYDIENILDNTIEPPNRIRQSGVFGYIRPELERRERVSGTREGGLWDVGIGRYREYPIDSSTDILIPDRPSNTINEIRTRPGTKYGYIFDDVVPRSESKIFAYFQDPSSPFYVTRDGVAYQLPQPLYGLDSKNVFEKAIQKQRIKTFFQNKKKELNGFEKANAQLNLLNSLGIDSFDYEVSVTRTGSSYLANPSNTATFAYKHSGIGIYIEEKRIIQKIIDFYSPGIKDIRKLLSQRSPIYSLKQTVVSRASKTTDLPVYQYALQKMGVDIDYLDKVEDLVYYGNEIPSDKSLFHYIGSGENSFDEMMAFYNRKTVAANEALVFNLFDETSMMVANRVIQERFKSLSTKARFGNPILPLNLVFIAPGDFPKVIDPESDYAFRSLEQVYRNIFPWADPREMLISPGEHPRDASLRQYQLLERNIETFFGKYEPLGINASFIPASTMKDAHDIVTGLTGQEVPYYIPERTFYKFNRPYGTRGRYQDRLPITLGKGLSRPVSTLGGIIATEENLPFDMPNPRLYASSIIFNGSALDPSDLTITSNADKFKKEYADDIRRATYQRLISSTGEPINEDWGIAAHRIFPKPSGAEMEITKGYPENISALWQRRTFFNIGGEQYSVVDRAIEAIDLSPGPTPKFLGPTKDLEDLFRPLPRPNIVRKALRYNLIVENIATGKTRPLSLIYNIPQQLSIEQPIGERIGELLRREIDTPFAFPDHRKFEFVMGQRKSYRYGEQMEIEVVRALVRDSDFSTIEVEDIFDFYVDKSTKRGKAIYRAFLESMSLQFHREQYQFVNKTIEGKGRFPKYNQYMNEWVDNFVYSFNQLFGDAKLTHIPKGPRFGVEFKKDVRRTKAVAAEAAIGLKQFYSEFYAKYRKFIAPALEEISEFRPDIILEANNNPYELAYQVAQHILGKRMKRFGTLLSSSETHPGLPLKGESVYDYTARGFVFGPGRAERELAEITDVTKIDLDWDESSKKPKPPALRFEDSLRGRKFTISDLILEEDSLKASRLNDITDFGSGEMRFVPIEIETILTEDEVDVIKRSIRKYTHGNISIDKVKDIFQDAAMAKVENIRSTGRIADITGFNYNRSIYWDSQWTTPLKNVEWRLSGEVSPNIDILHQKTEEVNLLTSDGKKIILPNGKTKKVLVSPFNRALKTLYNFAKEKQGKGLKIPFPEEEMLEEFMPEINISSVFPGEKQIEYMRPGKNARFDIIKANNILAGPFANQDPSGLSLYFRYASGKSVTRLSEMYEGNVIYDKNGNRLSLTSRPKRIGKRKYQARNVSFYANLPIADQFELYARAAKEQAVEEFVGQRLIHAGLDESTVWAENNNRKYLFSAIRSKHRRLRRLSPIAKQILSQAVLQSGAGVDSEILKLPSLNLAIPRVTLLNIYKDVGDFTRSVDPVIASVVEDAYWTTASRFGATPGQASQSLMQELIESKREDLVWGAEPISQDRILNRVRSLRVMGEAKPSGVIPSKLLGKYEKLDPLGNIVYDLTDQGIGDITLEEMYRRIIMVKAKTVESAFEQATGRSVDTDTARSILLNMSIDEDFIDGLKEKDLLDIAISPPKTESLLGSPEVDAILRRSTETITLENLKAASKAGRYKLLASLLESVETPFNGNPTPTRDAVVSQIYESLVAIDPGASEEVSKALEQFQSDISMVISHLGRRPTSSESELFAAGRGIQHISRLTEYVARMLNRI